MPDEKTTDDVTTVTPQAPIKDVTTPEVEDEYIPSSLSLGLAWGGGNRIITNYNYRFATPYFYDNADDNGDIGYRANEILYLNQEEQLNVLIPEEYDLDDYKHYDLLDYIILNVSDGGRIVRLDDSNFLSLSSINDSVVISCFRYDRDNYELYACDLIRGSDIIIDYEYEKVMFLMPDKFYIDNPDGNAILFFLEDFGA